MSPQQMKAKLREMEVARQRQEEERERQRTLEAVNSHFELSIELARKVTIVCTSRHIHNFSNSH